MIIIKTIIKSDKEYLKVGEQMCVLQRVWATNLETTISPGNIRIVKREDVKLYDKVFLLLEQW